MAIARPARFALPAPGLPVAAMLHAALLAWLASVAIQTFENVPIAEQSVEVELQTPEEFEALTRPKPPPAVAVPAPAPPVLPDAAPKPDEPAPSPQPPAPSPPRAAVEADGMIHPPRMLSQRVLADPRSRETVALLPRLAPDERVEQLCGLEAMGQIHDSQRDFEPDRVTAYAQAGTKLSGQVLTAEGAAFRSKRRWYGLRFACTVSADLKRVTTFAFQIGEPIPRERWEALGLPAVH
jgi:outer membrane biosynthesis protein TonB